jgi:hypothetical protein
MSMVSCRTDKGNINKNGTASKFSRTTYPHQMAMKVISEWNYMTQIYITLHSEGNKRYMFCNFLLFRVSNIYQHVMAVTSKHPAHNNGLVFL